jgi:outer membrane protein OmpA-like peptidoglycan-associated protein
MSHVAMKISEDAAVARSSGIKPVGRSLALITAVLFGLSACETIKETADSMGIFSDDENSSDTTADASAAGKAADPRKPALVQAGVEPVPADYVDYYMDQQEEKLRKQLDGTGVGVSRAGSTIILSMPGKTFASGSSKVDTKFHPVLDSVVLVLDEFNQTYVDIIGHTDSQGSKKFNQSLSEKRAKSVARYLESHVTPQRVLADGMGEDAPIASNDTSEGRALNRRVEIKLKPVT